MVSFRYNNINESCDISNMCNIQMMEQRKQKKSQMTRLSVTNSEPSRMSSHRLFPLFFFFKTIYVCMYVNTN